MIERDIDLLTATEPPADEVVALAAKNALDIPFQPNAKGKEPVHAEEDPFTILAGFSIWEAPVWTQKLNLGSQYFETRIRRHGDIWQCKVKRDDKDFSMGFADPECDDFDNAPEVFVFGNRVAVFANAGTYEFDIPDALAGIGDVSGGGDTVPAPMPGLVKKVSTEVGSVVQEGDALIVLEAMKMEHTLVAPRDGVIAEVNTPEGNQVEDGDILVRLETRDG